MSADPQAPEAARPPARRPRRLRLIWTLLAVLLLTSLVPLFLTAWKLMGINQESLEQASREHQLKVAAAIAQEINAVVTGATNQLSGIGRFLGNQLERTHMQDALRGDHLLDPYLKGDIVYLRYTSREGTVIEAGARERARGETVSAAMFEAFATTMVGEEYVGRPLPAADGGPGGARVLTAVPVRAHGQTRGSLVAMVDLDPAWRRTVESFAPQYTVFGLDDAGTLFASSNLPDPILASGTYGRLEIVRRYRADTGVSETIPFAAPDGFGVPELIGARVATRQGWGVFVIVDRALAYASVVEMKRSVYQWAVFAVALAVVAAVISAGAITRPLKQLVDHTRRLARGDFSARARIRSHNEIADLADTFNLMAEEIRNHIDRIKKAAEENSQLFLGTIKALAAAIDEKDPYTRGHSDRVHRYSVAIARRLGLPPRELRNITVGALLHDIGKIGIEDAILRKPAALSDKEFDIMKRHPLKGAHIMGEMPEMKEIIPAMRNHHEKWSGGGYPDNLKGEEIPMIARIVQVADTYDAMTTNRPYQRAMRLDSAVARIQELSGIVFDPRVVAAFREAWNAGELRGDEAAAQRQAV